MGNKEKLEIEINLLLELTKNPKVSYTRLLLGDAKVISCIEMVDLIKILNEKREKLKKL